VEITDPELIAKYKAAGIRFYEDEDGEWEALVRAEPMLKRETRALGGYFNAKDKGEFVRGMGFQTTGRLLARGFIERDTDVGDDREAYRITSAGEVEWLRIEAGKQVSDR
jgi:hypothetical protein